MNTLFSFLCLPFTTEEKPCVSRGQPSSKLLYLFQTAVLHPSFEFLFLQASNIDNLPNASPCCSLSHDE